LSNTEHKIIVGIAELAVSNDCAVTMATYALGACLGVAVYDPIARIGGLSHLMLPDSSMEATRAIRQPALFVNTGVPALLRAACELGAEKNRLIISVTGGAEILDDGDFPNLGARNHEVLARLFKELGLRVHAGQVGGQLNRSMSLNVATGEVRLKTSGQAGETLLLCKNSTNT
jgi:chemotaxis protein CheD